MGHQEKTTPKNYQVRVSVNAIQNIKEITGYIAFVNQQPLNAVKVGDALFATIDRISRNPLAFKECGELPTKAKIIRPDWLLIGALSSYSLELQFIIAMGNKKDFNKWRAEKLGYVYFSRLDDLIINEPNFKEPLFDYLIDIGENHKQTGRLFGVEVTSYNNDKGNLNGLLRYSRKHVA